MSFPKQLVPLSLFSGLLTILLSSLSPASSQSPLTVTPLASIPDTTTIRVEGEPVQVSLERFRPEGVPIEMGVTENSFVTRVDKTPRIARVRLSAGRQGQVTNDNARINIIWFKDLMGMDNIDDVEAWLFENSQERGITLQPIRDRRATYPWVRKRWRFEQGTSPRNSFAGRALIGQLNGQYFVVVHQLPVDSLEGYGPRIDAVLRTLQAR
ncbi:MAG: hypothetical protein ACFCBU_11560 [Cyanophyceae cyanobacterium]